MYFTGATVAGSPDTPNEDWLITTPDLIVVLDGATVRTETGCEHGAAWYARQLGAAIHHNGTEPAVSLTDVLARSISDVAARHRETCDLTHPGTPSAGVAIVRLVGAEMHWLVLGDVTVAIETSVDVKVVSDQRISASAAAERAEVDRHPIGSPEKAEALVAMKRAELAARGVEYWVAAADPTAAEQAITGSAYLADVRRFAVATDGAARWVDLYRAGDWSAALKMLASSGPDTFIRTLVRAIEHNDPAGKHYRRNKASDDASIVFAQVAEPPAPQQQTSPVRPTREIPARISSPRLYGDGMLIQHRELPEHAVDPGARQDAAGAIHERLTGLLNKFDRVMVSDDLEEQATLIDEMYEPSHELPGLLAAAHGHIALQLATEQGWTLEQMGQRLGIGTARANRLISRVVRG